jgi:predicted DCC family thiol-disulfide oxidoreductase YuxK
MERAPYSYRSDPGVPAFPDDRPIIIYDGHCVLCSAFIRFVLRADRAARFRFMAAQSRTGAALYAHYGLVSHDYETNILLEDGRVWLKSEGSIRIFEKLGLPWALAAAGRILPRALRDRLYDIVARNRLRWFGVRQSCLLVEPGHAERFVA